MIPDFLENGFLPEGVHEATFEEVIEKFQFSKKREELIEGLRLLIDFCLSLNVNIIYLDGSFVSNKISPNDFDACFDTNHPDRKNILKNVDRTRLTTDSVIQKLYYKGEIYFAYSIADYQGTCFLEFFQKIRGEEKKRKPIKKGIVKIILADYGQE